MRTLVVYGTKSGCTKEIAEAIGAELTAKGATVDVVAAEQAGDPSGYDSVVVGSGVRAGNWHASARQWVEHNAAALRERPIALFSCGLIPARVPEGVAKGKAYTDSIVESTGIRPVDVGAFGATRL